ncbi:hypothetical protein V1512DRAFT_261508 [Lipomyces arxii]|uniref:uncharacterized protein n=1 Tax=Lipomyces arxii TaxID=56418 RepID=UPI0034CDDE1D
MVMTGIWRGGRVVTRRVAWESNLLRADQLASRQYQIQRYSTTADAHKCSGTVAGLKTEPSLTETRFDNVFLRDACSCSECLDPSSKQKHFSTGQIPLDIHPSSVIQTDHGATKISWTSALAPPHVSVYSEATLEHYGSPLSRYNHRWKFAREQNLWNSKNLQISLVSRSYDEYMNDELAFKDVVLGLYSEGLAFITDAPQSEKTSKETIVVEKVAKKIGYIKETFYGTSWDVVSSTNAKNIAYTSANLPLHMDLLYYESPPGIQLLHCIANDAQGGESVYVDSFRSAYLVCERFPAAFHALCTFPITFHYQNDGYHYMNTRPLIELDPFYNQPTPSHPPFRIKCVNYSPPFQAPFEHYISSSDLESTDLTEHGKFRSFLKAFKKFEEILFDEAEQYEEKFVPGRIALFMNRRVLHSRREFKLQTNSHGRWLKGAYLDIDSFYSKLRVVSKL